MMKKALTLFLALVCCTALAAQAFAAAPDGSLDNFKQENTYLSGMFTDVSDTDWFAENVQSAYAYGLMGGNGSTFSPKENITLAQVLAIACRLHSIYQTGTENFEQGEPWYQVYVDYAAENGITSANQYQSYTAAAMRREVAEILAKAMPDALTEKNIIEDGAIPDVAAGSTGYSEIYTLYRAGIAGGSGSNHAFHPDTPVSRAETAAMITRMVDPSLRLEITIQQPDASGSDAAVFTPVPMADLANKKSLQRKATDEQLAQAYAEAVELVTPYAGLSLEEQLEGVAIAMRLRFESGMSYSMESQHYNDPYGYFIEGSASCAGCTRATGLCLNILGISYEHINENQYSHQWCRVNVNGTYWICDPYGLYCGPEPAPYAHPYL